MPQITVSADQHSILFWVFFGFFLLIGIISLLAIVGVFPTERSFRKWILTGFFAPIIGVIVFVAKSPVDSLLYINVNLIPPEDIRPQTLTLIKGTYKYAKQSELDDSANLSSDLELVAPQESPYWQAKFPLVPPSKGNSSRTVTLSLTDNMNRSWEVQAFYPNFRSDHLKLKAIQPLEKDSQNTLPNFGLLSSAYAKEEIDANRTATPPLEPKCLNYPAEVKFTNWTKPSGEQDGGRNYYIWRVFVDEDTSILSCIEEIQYILHPTFPNPLQTRKSPEDKFSLEMSGWGTFEISIIIKLNNGAVLNTRYMLDFSKPWPP